MLLSTAANYLKLTFILLKANVKSAMEYRINFIMQIIAMALSDAAWATMWSIFFMRFSVVNGWTLQDTMTLMSLSSFNIGIHELFASGCTYLAKQIANGDLDHHLCSPRNILWNICLSKINTTTALGDILFGFIIYFFTGLQTSKELALFALMVVLTTIIIFNFVLITQSIGFFVGNFEDAADQLFISLLFTSYTPQGGTHGFLKIIMFTIVPGLVIGAIPITLIKHFSTLLFLILIGFCIISSLLAWFVFTQGLKRYESGNLINVKI